MALIPKKDPIQSAIENGYIKQEHRPYIGVSSLGGACSRKIWYDFRWAYNHGITQRLKRLFARGDYEEIVVANDLESADIAVFDEQAEMIDSTGHIKGHVDGKVLGVPGNEEEIHLLEIKTMSDKNFKIFKKKGLKEFNPAYWSQIHTYMGEFDLYNCLYIVTNKNDECRSYQIFPYDEGVHLDTMQKGFSIIIAESPPPKIGEPTWFECKFCNAKGICHMNEPIEKTCRTCVHVNIAMEGVFECCYRNDAKLTVQQQRDACDEYEILGM